MSHIRRYQHAVRQSLLLHPGEASLLHGLVFLTNIGLPVLAGLWLGDTRAGIAGGLVGLFFSLSDCNAGLPARLLVLARALLFVFAFGYLGYLTGADTLAFWVIIIGIAFFTARASLSARPYTPALRYGLIVLIFMAETHEIGGRTILLILLAGLTAAVTRALSCFFAPELGVIVIPRGPAGASAGGRGFRFCLAYSGMVGLALLAGEREHIARPLWVATTVLLVMQPDVLSTWQRVIQRMVGTLCGVAAAGAVAGLLHSVGWLTTVILMVAFLLPQGSSRNYWLHSALSALLVLLLYDLAGAARNFDLHLLTERFLDVTLGCILAALGTVLAFMRPAGGTAQAAPGRSPAPKP